MLVPVRWLSRTEVRGWWVGVLISLREEGMTETGRSLVDHFSRVERRVGMAVDSWACIRVQSVVVGVEGSAGVSGEHLRFLLGWWAEERSWPQYRKLQKTTSKRAMR